MLSFTKYHVTDYKMQTATACNRLFTASYLLPTRIKQGEII